MSLLTSFISLSSFSSLSSSSSSISDISSSPNSPLYSSLSWTNTWKWKHTFWTLGIISYLILVRILRYRRRDNLARKYGYTTRESFANMTDDDAMTILRDLVQLEFPKMYSISIFFALFKTYGIPSISKLLLRTNQLSSDQKTTSKRAADTGIILAEIIFNSPTSTRHIDALSRMNFLHDPYRKSGKITDDDMLYTLSLFALEPSRWISKYEWRELTDLERCATGVFFRQMGEGMEIPFGEKLARFMPSTSSDEGEEKTKTGWGKDGLEWMEALEQWSREYERTHMTYSESNQKLAKLTLELFMFNVPKFLSGMVMGFIGAVLEPRLREAMAIPPPTRTQRQLLTTIITIRNFIIRYLSPPRPESLRARFFTQDIDPKTGRYHALRYRAHPWYVKPTISNRYGPVALVTKFLLGGILPGDDGVAYHPEGYKIHEVGPKGFEGRGMEEMRLTSEKLIRERRRRPEQGRGGCPMVLG